MDLTTFLVTVAIAFGLIGSDAYLNHDTLYLEATVSKNLVDEGYTPYAVVDRVVDQMKRMSHTESLVSPPNFRASTTKSFAVSLAQAASAENVMLAIQDLIGFVPPSMLATVIAKGDDVKIIISGYSEDAGFLKTSADGKINDMEALFYLAALNVILRIDPYTAILNHVVRSVAAGTHDIAREWIRDVVASLPDTPRNTERAYLENLRRVIALLENDDKAESYFRKAARSKPDFTVAWLNLAFTLMHQGKYQDAIDVAENVTRPQWWELTDDPRLRSSAWNMVAMGRSRLGDSAGAVAAFQAALEVDPESAETYVYWSCVLSSRGQTVAAAQKLDAARRNAGQFINYPEVAMLYFWVPDQSGTMLAPRPNSIDGLAVAPKG